MAINNTTSLSMGGNRFSGTIGTRDFKDFSARQISSEISRTNYRKGLQSDQQLQKFREAVYKMVYNWSMEDKIMIITEYGDSGFLKNYKHPDNDIVSKICTESIIIHLDPGDLQQLYNDIGRETSNLRKDIRDIKKKRKQIARSALNTKNFEAIYGNLMDAKNQAEYKKSRDNDDPTYSVPKYLTHQYGNLRRELLDVLRTCFDKIELTNIAIEMGIPVPTGIPARKLFQRIINKVLLYVDLIIGKSKINLAGAIVDRAPYDKLLQYTSYSYVTGKPGMGPGEWAELKKEARRAKRAIAERARLQRPGSFRTRGRSMASVTGGNTANTLRGLAKKIRDNDQGILKDMDYEELARLAGKYGIDPTSRQNRDIGTLKAKIYNGMRNEARRVSTLEKAQSKLQGKGKTTRAIDDLLSIYKKGGSAGSSSSGGVPIVSFNSRGRILTENIFEAVPVYIVGNAGAGFTGSGSGRQAAVGASFIFKKYGTKAGLSANITGRGDLSKESAQLLAHFESLKFFSYVGGVRATDAKNPGARASIDPLNIKSLQEAIINLKIAGAMNNNLETQIYSDSGYHEDQIGTEPSDSVCSQLCMRILWVYAMYMKKKDLASYLTNRFGIFYKLPRLKRAVRTTGRVLLGVATLGLSVLIRKTKKLSSTIERRIRESKVPRSFGELSNKSKQTYQTLLNLNFSTLLTLIRPKMGSNFGKLEILKNKYETSEVLGGIDTCKKLEAILRAAIALRVYSDMALANLYLYTNGIIDENGNSREDEFYEYFKGLTKGGKGSILNRIGSLKNRVASIFGRRQYNTGVNAAPTDVFDPESNPGQRPAIPKIGWNSGTNSLLGNILEVVPVYVVNQAGGSGNPRYTEGIGSNVSLGDQYNLAHGLPLGKGKNDIVFSKSAADNVAAMQALGYTPVSKSLIGGKRLALPGGRFKVSNADLKWALNQSPVYKFASGGLLGTSAIVGDSLNGKPNEEVVSWHPNGLSVRPVKAGPENGYSPLAMNRFASGGGLLGKLFGGKNKNTTVSNLPGKITEGSSIISDEGFNTGKIKNIFSAPAIPVYVINRYAQKDDLVSTLVGLNDSFREQMAELKLGLSNEVLAAPMGVGAVTRPYFLATGIAEKIVNTVSTIAKNTASTVRETLSGLNTGGFVTKAASGAKYIRSVPRAFTGMNSVITGDARGNNIFKGGAKPELVSSNGDLRVQPLNRTGTESRQKVSRMTTEERRQALATAVSSHIVKYNYTLPGEAEDLANVGEAIKVFNVKPGITDEVSVGSEKTTLINLLSGIYAQLTAISQSNTVNSSLLTTISANTAVQPVATTTSSNPFTGGFTDSLDEILGGN